VSTKIVKSLEEGEAGEEEEEEEKDQKRHIPLHSTERNM